MVRGRGDDVTQLLGPMGKSPTITEEYAASLLIGTTRSPLGVELVPGVEAA